MGVRVHTACSASRDGSRAGGGSGGHAVVPIGRARGGGRRGVWASIAAVLLSVMTLLLASPARVDADKPVSSKGDRALEDFSTCLQSSPNLAVLLLVDSSKSL